MNLNSTFTQGKSYILTYRLNLRAANSKSINTNNKITKNNNGAVLNTSKQNLENDTKSIMVQNQLAYTRNFKKENRFLSISLSTENSNQKTNGLTNSENLFLNSTITNELRNLKETKKNNAEKYASSITFREPILDSLQIELGLNGGIEKNSINNEAFNIDSNSITFNIINSLLTIKNNTANTKIRPSFAVDFTKQKINNRISFATEFLNLKSDINFMQELIKTDKNYTLFSANESFNYTISTKYTVNLNYDFSTNAPDNNQLVVVNDFTDPLNTSKGNLDLKPFENHSIALYMNHYDVDKTFGFNFNSYLGITNNAIITAINLDESLKSTTTFVNNGSIYNLNFGFETNKMFGKSDNKFSVIVGLNYNQSNFIGLTNNVLLESINTQIIPRFNFNYTFKESINIGTSYNFCYGDVTNNDVNSSNFKNTSHNFTLTSSFNLTKKLVFTNDFNGVFNRDITANFQNNFVLWNSSLHYTFLKDKLQAKIKVFDVLKQNANTTRVISKNVVTDSQNNTVSQYFMFSMIYNFKNI